MSLNGSCRRCAPLGAWGREKISSTAATDQALVLLGLKENRLKTETRGKNRFLQFAEDMKAFQAEKLRHGTEPNTAVKLIAGMEYSDIDDKARNVRKRIKRGKGLKQSPPNGETSPK
jgi:hypothetical protein